MRNETMIKIYRISFVFLLILFLLTSMLGFSKDLMFKISLLIGIFMVITFILVLFEIQEDYFNKQILLIVDTFENKNKTNNSEESENGNKKDISEQ